MVAAGALGWLAGLYNAPITGLILATQQPRMPALLVRLIQTFPDVILAVARALAEPLMTQSLAILIAGAGLCLAAFLTRSHNSKPEKETSN